MNEQLHQHEEKFKTKIRVYEQYSANLTNLATYTDGTEKQLKELLEKYHELQSLVNQTKSLSATSQRGLFNIIEIARNLLVLTHKHTHTHI